MCLQVDDQKNKQPSSHKVFINYYERDFQYAQRLFSDLSAASLSPWIDRENLLPGQLKDLETDRAIRECRFFIALLSAMSVQSKGDFQSQIETAKEVLTQFPESSIYLLPARIDDVHIPDGLKKIQYVDMFPVWEDGLRRILKSMDVNQEHVESVVIHQRTISPFVLMGVSQGATQIQTFKGEKQFFIGRQNYISQILKDKLISPNSKVSIVGPGGSGKSQLAFKAIREYVKEGIFDLVIPIYFDEGLLPFDKFLLQMAEIFGLRANEFESNNTIQERKDIIRGLLGKRKYPLIYLDNFETVSLILNDKTSSDTQESIQNANQITDFLNNIVPLENTSILVTSREKKNNLSSEYPIDLEGLNLDDSMRLFNNFVRPEFKDLEGETRDKIEEIVTKTGGHPLSIEIIAKNLRSIHELKNISRDLGSMGDPTQAEKRFQTLQVCFEYTIKRLDNRLQELIPKLALFKSPFPISAAVEVLGANENQILDLFDRSLLKLVNTDEIFGKIQDPKYWLYKFYLPVRGYVEGMMERNGPSIRNLETAYGEVFSKYYHNLLVDTYNSIGKENHRSSLARFNIIQKGGDNDFQSSVGLARRWVSNYEEYSNFRRAAELVPDKQQRADILRYLGKILEQLGILSDARKHHERAKKIHEEMNDPLEVAEDYSNIGKVLYDSAGRVDDALEYHNQVIEGDRGLSTDVEQRLNEALEYHNRALEIHTKFNDVEGMARDYNEIGAVLRDKEKYDESLDYYEKAIAIHKEPKYRSELAQDYYCKSFTYCKQNENVKALNCVQKALKIHEEFHYRVKVAADYKNMGIVLNNMGRHAEALDYHNKALKIHEEFNDPVGMARDHYNMSYVYMNTKNENEALKSLSKAADILLEFEKTTNYHHPLIDHVNLQISNFKGK
jgi:tetratricopeptide (TPR) repeat protein